MPSARDRIGDDALSPLGRLVRTSDRDRFLTALFAPVEHREALFGLYGFNAELARVREIVSEPMLGRIRLQWWRESIEAIYEGRPVRRHEVVEPLAETIRARGLSRAYFDRMIDAREADLAGEPPPDLDSLEAFAEASAAPLVLLALEALGARDAPVVTAGREVGIAYALAGLLAATRFHAAKRRTYLPGDLLAAQNIQLHRTIYELKPAPGLAAVAAAVAARARAHLDAARARRRDVPRAALPALLPAVLASRLLTRLERVGFDLLSARLARPDGGKSLGLTLAALLGRY